MPYPGKEWGADRGWGGKAVAPGSRGNGTLALVSRDTGAT